MFMEELLRRRPDLSVVRQDLAVSPPPPVSEEWIAAAFATEELRTREMRNALRVSDELIHELLACDLYVLGLPMYNFSVPSVFKAYIDQIVRVGRTFSFDPDRKAQPYRGLIEGKSVLIIAARGDTGYGAGGSHWSKNHLEPYVAEVFQFLGITNIRTVAIENDEYGGLSLRESIRAAEARLRDLAAEIAQFELV